MDTIKGLALIGTFIGFLTIFSMRVSLWDNVWRVVVQPVRSQAYTTQMSRALDHSAGFRSSLMRWRLAGCRLT
jgi:hypothetical protein